MEDPKLYIRSPGKKNISYFFRTVNDTNFDKFFEPLIQELKTKQYDCERVVIFSNRDNVTGIFGAFHHVLGDDFPIYETRPYAMFHSTTEDPIKKHIVKSFQDPKGTIRVLFATIAFGMGIDCKNLHNVIHFGPPADLDSYFQESGRAGRDGEQSSALLLKYPKSFIRGSTKSIKDYCSTTKKCRRDMLLDLYESEPTEILPQHNCCDFCYEQCDCGDCRLPRFYVNFPDPDFAQSDLPNFDEEEEDEDDEEEDTECREHEDDDSD